ncbi:DUF3363 domain-containing protein [Caballeronia sp. SEWSISQ10-4 2]|uniref:DUF3363 domain-containing protein n=1 Tax=Caballeronia sp. SEWSISQ10-4 2 TaxID=2937438 RepID=UPI002650ABEA|nr:DUF3363 domain-containing protein [Caballeronia sp. SEWSISQ10-4 2]MDN7179173.1 DUF3363 domain-containing protein [Caballeronia sp. SEWSISQ10-4 2]
MPATRSPPSLSTCADSKRCAGIEECIADGVWKVPPDLLQKVQNHDALKATSLVIELRSQLPIEQQVRAIGVTWLDQQLVGDGGGLAAQGFGAKVSDDMPSRVDSLAERRGQRMVLARNLLATLRDKDLAAAGKALQNQTGQTYRPAQDGYEASGVYGRSIQLTSGPFAMLDDGMGFSASCLGAGGRAQSGAARVGRHARPVGDMALVPASQDSQLTAAT